MVEDSSSLSILNYDWGTTNITTDLIYPLSLDPLFSNFYVEIPVLLKEYLKNTNFTYKHTDNNLLTIKNLKTNNPLFEVEVVDFKNIESIDPYVNKYFLILNKEKYKKQVKSKINKMYKKFTENKINDVAQPDYKIDNKYESKKDFLFYLQINHKLNYFYVKDSIHQVLLEKFKTL